MFVSFANTLFRYIKIHTWHIAAERLARFFTAAVELMTVVARAAGHRHLSEFGIEDLTTFKRDMADLTGVAYGGVGGR